MCAVRVTFKALYFNIAPGILLSFDVSKHISIESIICILKMKIQTIKGVKMRSVKNAHKMVVMEPRGREKYRDKG